MPPSDDNKPPEDENPATAAPKVVKQVGAFFPAREENFDGANDEALALRLNELEQEHRDLDAAINALATTQTHDRLSVARLKKKKLQLKDLIQQIKDQLTPDIIA